MKALFFNVPAHGHINPSLPLVTELVQRGHQITYFASENYRARLEATGAVFMVYSSVGDDYFDAQGLHAGVPQKVAHALITTTRMILPELLEKARTLQPDYVIYDGMCTWGYMVAKVLGVPAVASLALMPLTSPPPTELLNMEMLGTIWSLIVPDFGKGIEASRIAGALAKQYKVPPLGMIRIINAPSDLSISYTSRYFQPYADTVTDNIHYIGRIMDDTVSDPTFSFERVQGRKLVYVSLGTINNDDLAFFKACIKAFKDSDYYVMMTTGKRIAPESFSALPENIAIYPWVPQLDVLRRAALFITHGGMGSIHDGLYFGIPLLVVPQQGDQIFTARRVVELGAGLRLKKQQVNAESLRENAQQLLTNAQFSDAARRVSESLKAGGGAAKGADAIEALLKR